MTTSWKTRALAAFAVLLGLSARPPAAASQQLPAGWQVPDARIAQPFLDLLNRQQKYAREGNVALYLALQPEFLAVKLRNEAKSNGWDDETTAGILQGLSLSESGLQRLETVAFKRENLTAALAFRRRRAGPREANLMIQRFHMEGTTWKVGERSEIQLRDTTLIGPELRDVTFYKTLPAPAQLVGVVEIMGMYQIGGLQPGMTLEWSVNGIAQPVMTASSPNTSTSGLVIGGVKKGRNIVRATLTGPPQARGDGGVSITLRAPAKSFEEMKRVKPYVSWTVQTVGTSTREFEVP